jgi:hypothetical protein
MIAQRSIAATKISPQRFYLCDLCASAVSFDYGDVAVLRGETLGDLVAASRAVLR